MLIRISAAVPKRIKALSVYQFMLDRGLAQNAEMKTRFELGTQITGDFITVDADPTKALTHEQLLFIIGDLQKSFPGVGVAIDVS